MKTDAEFYELARAFPMAYVLLLLGEGPHGEYKATSLTLKRAERQIDLVLEPSGPEDPWLVVECQGYYDRGAERNLIHKAVCLAEEQGLWGRIEVAMVYTTASVAAASLPPRLGHHSYG